MVHPPCGEGGFYGEGRYGYTISASTVIKGSEHSKEADFQDIDFNTEVSASKTILLHQIFKVPFAISDFTNPDLKSFRWNFVDADCCSSSKVLHQFTKVVGSNIQVIVITADLSVDLTLLII